MFSGIKFIDSLNRNSKVFIDVAEFVVKQIFIVINWNKIKKWVGYFQIICLGWNRGLKVSWNLALLFF